MGLWSLFFIILVFKVVFTVILKIVGEINIGLMLVMFVPLLFISVGWLSPLFFNTILSFIGLNGNLTWVETLPLSMTIAVWSADFNKKN